MHFSRSLQLLGSIIFISLIANTTSAQKWTPVKDSDLASRADQRIFVPQKYKVYHLEIDELRGQLAKANPLHEQNVTVSLPVADGSFADFVLDRRDVFHPDLAAKYPNIQAYTGYNKNTPSQLVKLSISHKGMDAMIYGSGEKVFVDRYAHGDEAHYISYFKNDYEGQSNEEFHCEVEVPADEKIVRAGSHRYGDCTLRTYRLALACTAEYANFHGGTVEDVLAEYNTAMNRVNGVYERDAAITMQIIPNTDTLIFFDAQTDPYTNNDGGDMLGENQATVDARIGSSNYDIGHVFSTGGGGIASLRSPCTGRKARGVTGLGSPINDPFYIDYVAHEMGHQFGGNHCYNNSCSDNRNNSTAVEPGSGATIMAYAGICAPNVQNNSDDYFHTVSLNEIADFVVAGNGGCAEETPLANNPPSVDELTEDEVIPGGTPFALTASAGDDDNDELTYTWEQMDTEIVDMPPVAESTGGPTFRSYEPITSDTRYFPRLSNILDGTNGNTWEVLPVMDREMNFRVTVRDNAPGGGCTDFGDVKITVDGDTSTSDTVLAFATGKAGNPPIASWDDAGADAFYAALLAVCRELAQLVVRDGEGAQKFIEIAVTGADNNASAQRVGMSIANSPLVKTAIAGGDANWGRVVMAVGKAGEPADRDKLSIGFGGVWAARDGQPLADYDEAPVARHLEGEDIRIDVDLGIGDGRATVWTCDLTHGYISINADYRS